MFFWLLTWCLAAQQPATALAFHVGEGDQTAYFVADFKDGTDDRSYIWGIRFSANDAPTGIEMLQLIADAEPQFSFEQSSGFLDQIAFNAHDSYLQDYDFWSLWVAPAGQSWQMAGWMSNEILAGNWYGASYGWSNPTVEEPVDPLPAYSSLWFTTDDVVEWIGTGNNESLVVIDFGTHTEDQANSFAIGIRYNGTLTAEAALALIQANSAAFTYQLNAGAIESLQLGAHTFEATVNSTSSIYTGSDLSNWTTSTSLNAIELQHGDWLGLSFGARRPYLPQEASALLDAAQFTTTSITIYPNPTADYLYIQQTESLQSVKIYAVSGQLVHQSTASALDVSGLANGVYWLYITTEKGTTQVPFIKK